MCSLLFSLTLSIGFFENKKKTLATWMRDLQFIITFAVMMMMISSGCVIWQRFRVLIFFT